MAKKKRRMNKKAKRILILFLFIIVLGAGIYFYLNKPKDVVKKKEEKIKKEEKKLKIVDLNSTSRPYAVMINNINVARPLQSGLQDAYIVYEIIVEGGITRYMALFLDQNTERIGSIRSSRHYFLDYAMENDAIYVHHGQSPQAQSDFSKFNIDRIVVDGSNTGWRDRSLNVSSEHTLFTSIEKLNTSLNKFRTKRKGNLLLKYSVDEIDLSKMEGAITANSVSIPYSNYITSSYTYDQENKVYKRFVNNSEHKDYVTGTQYTFKNIITYKVKNYNLNDGSGKGRQDINNVGSGEGYYISSGYAIPITWQKTSRESKTIYRYKDGKELVVNDGNTFIQIQPEGQTLTIN